MTPSDGHSRTGLIDRLLDAHAEVGAGQRRLLDTVAHCDRAELWRHDGARDIGEWLAARLGISPWAARRWVTAARALPHLPSISAALDAGELCLDKVLELCRFATPEMEQKLIPWARKVSAAAVRRRADVACRLELDDVRAAHNDRYLRYWSFDGGARVGLEGSLSADQGQVVISALDRLAGRMPAIVPDDEDEPDPESLAPEDCLDARRADALVALCSARIAADPDPDRATVVVHTDLAALVTEDANAELERGPVIHPQTALRLSCDCRLQTVLHGRDGTEVGIGRTSRNVPRWLARALLKRDRGCLFPGCGARAFLHAHHIRHWVKGGPTDLDNLALLCSFHHRLVHEHGWNLVLGEPGTALWYWPSGARYNPTQGSAQLLDRAPPERLEVA